MDPYGLRGRDSIIEYYQSTLDTHLSRTRITWIKKNLTRFRLGLEVHINQVRDGDLNRANLLTYQLKKLDIFYKNIQNKEDIGKLIEALNEIEI